MLRGLASSKTEEIPTLPLAGGVCGLSSLGSSAGLELVIQRSSAGSQYSYVPAVAVSDCVLLEWVALLFAPLS